jgi:uncharacterized OB-fold protein
MKTIEEQVNRIKLIMERGGKNFITCDDCGKVYLPMNKITLHLCPFCKQDAILNLEAGPDLEIVSREFLED